MLVVKAKPLSSRRVREAAAEPPTDDEAFAPSQAIAARLLLRREYFWVRLSWSDVTRRVE